MSNRPTPFKDSLRIPPVLKPRDGHGDDLDSVRLKMRPAKVRVHSELPETEMWTYEGSFPGPTIETRRGRKVRIDWINQLDTPMPVIEVKAPGAQPQNAPGLSGGTPDGRVAALPSWTVVHLHGGRTAAASDGWTENATLLNQSGTAVYDLDQRAALLWYHDHGMGITRLNVFAGLAGAWIVRDDEEAGARLPSGKREIPLLLQDRNFDTNPDGTISGRLLHKVADDTMEFFGPYTLVNGTIWPHLDVEGRLYRFRVLNGSNARTYRLHLVDAGNRVVNGAIRQIGTDGGLLGNPVAIPETGLILAPAERADLLIDFHEFAGKRLRLVNNAGAPFDNSDGPAPGDAAPESLLPYPEVMEFRVSAHAEREDAPIRTPLSTFQPVTHGQMPSHEHRLIALVEGTPPGMTDSMLTMRELLETDASHAGEPGVVEVRDAAGKSTFYRTAAMFFEDTVNFFPRFGEWEIWKVLNLTEDTHPFHIHLVQAQLMTRQTIDAGGFDSDTGSTPAGSPVTLGAAAPIDANEHGWKDTFRVNPSEMISFAAKFDGFTGRYMYHCHVLEHEDMEMMRPFVVMPGAVMDLMPTMKRMPMGGMVMKSGGQ